MKKISKKIYGIGLLLALQCFFSISMPPRRRKKYPTGPGRIYINTYAIDKDGFKKPIGFSRRKKFKQQKQSHKKELYTSLPPLTKYVHLSKKELDEAFEKEIKPKLKNLNKNAIAQFRSAWPSLIAREKQKINVAKMSKSQSD